MNLADISQHVKTSKHRIINIKMPSKSHTEDNISSSTILNGKKSVMHSVVDIIRAKRDQKELNEHQIQTFIDKISSNGDDEEIQECQIGAFLMAVFLNGLTPSESSFLTKAMTYSGYTFQWPAEWRGTIVDKHSTGGVGDKVSLILAPALAACGLRVPMVSGRGLDFTGGTLDKLESIPGFTVSMTPERMLRILSDDGAGCCIVGQTEDLVPADRQLYRIRDVTATVDNEDLIVASIISKKAAENLDALVLDVKCGKGAFMKDVKSARSLATKMVQTGNTFGMKVTAVLTTMDSPLGRYVGNSLEVVETLEVLQNGGAEDLRELVFTLGGILLESTGRAKTLDAGKKQIAESIENGSALCRFERMIIEQGTESSVAQELCHGDKWKVLPRAKSICNITSLTTGYVESIDAMVVAKVCHALGCGRSQPGKPVKFEPGVVLRRKPGETVQEGDVLIELHHNEISETQLTELISQLREAYSIVPTLPQLPTLIIETVV